MASGLIRRDRSRSLDPMDWFEDWSRPFSMFRPFAEGSRIRVEDFVEKGTYVLRADLPGVDPEKDVEITVRDGMLRVQAERRDSRQEGHRSEFRYGSFSRTVTLPAGANEDDVRATYRDGVLEVRVGLAEREGDSIKRIPISKE